MNKTGKCGGMDILCQQQHAIELIGCKTAIDWKCGAALY